MSELVALFTLAAMMGGVCLGIAIISIPFTLSSINTKLGFISRMLQRTNNNQENK